MNPGLTPSQLQRRGRRMSNTESARCSIPRHDNLDENYASSHVVRWLESLPTNQEWFDVDNDISQGSQRGDFTYSKEGVLNESRDYIRFVDASRKNGVTRTPTKRGKKKKLSACPRKKETNSKIARNKMLLKVVEEIVDDLERDGLVSSTVTLQDNTVERKRSVKSIKSNTIVPVRKPRGNLTQRTASKHMLGLQKPFFQNKELERNLDEVMETTIKKYRNPRTTWRTLLGCNPSIPNESPKEYRRLPAFNLN